MYQKPYLTIPQQVELLRDRGMLVEDEAKASEYLQRIGYYRLSAYWHPMRLRNKHTNEVTSRFCEGATFKAATDLYIFDGRLRLIMLDALERLEVSLRTEVALSIGSHDPKAHRNLSVLGRDFGNPVRPGGITKHREWLQRLDNRASVSKDQFAIHFRTKYPNDDMPIWMAVELMDFGPLSHLISGLTNSDLAKIGSHYGGINPILLKSWARSMAFSRNVCAHHSRLWNKPLVNQPALSGKAIPVDLRHLHNLHDSGKRLYTIACIARFMLKFANPRTSWKDRFVDHIMTFPATNQISLSSAGFPNDWQTESLWR